MGLVEQTQRFASTKERRKRSVALRTQTEQEYFKALDPAAAMERKVRSASEAPQHSINGKARIATTQIP
jgi:hypothetical protein